MSNFTSRNLGTGRPAIQCTACGEYSHWRKDCPYDNFCTTCDNHDHATHMCRATCQSSAICIHCGNISHRSGNCPRNSQDNREQLHATPDTLRQHNQQANTENSGSAHGNAAMAGSGTSRHSSQSHACADAKISRNSRSHHGNNYNSGSRHSRYQQNDGYYRDQQRNDQQHARFDERYNQWYLPPAYPATPSLNSTFHEALSKSLLQIAENQSCTIEAMKASQEAQAEAYKEMTKTNKMRDDDALFHSIEVYNGSNPTKFEKWMDSIDQATHITGRDLQKESMKKSDGVVRNTLSIMDVEWTDDAIIAKLHQNFSSLSTMNRA